MVGKTFYINAKIIIGNGQVIDNGMVVVEHNQSEGKVTNINDVIAFVGSMDDLNDMVKVVEGDELVNMEGCTILPGLFDANIRLDLMNKEDETPQDMVGTSFRTFLSYRHAAEALNVGVTSLGVMGMPDDIDLALKTSISKNMFFGPDITTSGPKYIVTKGKGSDVYGNVEISGADQIRKQARLRLSKGIDHLVLGVSGDALDALQGAFEPQMNHSEINAVAELAHAFGRNIFAVASGKKAISYALDSKVTAIIKGQQLTVDVISRMIEDGTYYIPSLCDTKVNQDAEAFESHLEDVKKAIEHGVEIVVGTGMLSSEPVDGTVAIVKEMELLEELGMTPGKIIESATRVASEMFGKSKQSGTLESGKKADFIAVKGDPYESMKKLREIVLVVKNGRRAFADVMDCKERQFHIQAPLYTVEGGTKKKW